MVSCEILQVPQSLLIFTRSNHTISPTTSQLRGVEQKQKLNRNLIAHVPLDIVTIVWKEGTINEKWNQPMAVS